MKPSNSSFTSSISTTPNKKPPSVASLNLSKVPSYQQTQDLDTSKVSNLNSSKFQFDIMIHKVELQAPSPVYIFVQVVKGTNSVNTKKKLRVDQNNKVAQFNDKISIVTALEKEENEHSSIYLSKQIQLKLYAFYNSKEKVIGYCSFDLSTFVNSKELKGQQQKLMFQKCFDKHASITYEVKVKEQFTPITESIIEETSDQSHIIEDSSDLVDTSRISTFESARLNTNEEDSIDDKIFLEQKSHSQNESIKDLSRSSTFTPNSKISDPKLAAFIQNSSKQEQSRTLNSARTLNISMSAAHIKKQVARESKSPINNSQQQEESFSHTLAKESTNSSINDYQIKQLEERNQQLELDIKFLKKENQEQRQKIVSFELREERTREYELKCKEVESYRQKCEILEQHIRKFEQEANEIEQEKILIIESYERKITEMKQQLNENQIQIQSIKQLQQQYSTTSNSTQPDEEQKTPSKIEEEGEDSNNYKTMYEKLLLKFKLQGDELGQQKRVSEQLEGQVMICKGQIAQLVNELYSIEKEQINSYS